MIQLGLIGSGISRSSSPRLHGFLGKLYGVNVDYKLIDSETTTDFEFGAALDRCAEEGYRGVNVTHPFKEKARARVRVADPNVARLGAVNTVTFEADGPQGNNTDYSGFAKAFRHRFGTVSPGRVVMLGAGGVGKAMGFALGVLGASEVVLYDTIAAQADGLAALLREAGYRASVITADEVADAVRSSDGLINGTPIGMWQHPGNPFPEAAIGGQRWAFDAVYTPLVTEFLACARKAGVDTMSGYDLFLFQGFDAFAIFTGVEVDPAAALEKFPPPPEPKKTA